VAALLGAQRIRPREARHHPTVAPVGTRLKALPARHQWGPFAVTTTQSIPITFAVRALHVGVVFVSLPEALFVVAVASTIVLRERRVVATHAALQRPSAAVMKPRALVQVMHFLYHEMNLCADRL